MTVDKLLRLCYIVIMATTKVTKQTPKPSVLANFKLGFEYDMTWVEVHKQLKK